jgi:hypothetical protein
MLDGAEVSVVMVSRGLAGADSTAPAAALAEASAIARIRISKVFPWLDRLHVALDSELIVVSEYRVALQGFFPQCMSRRCHDKVAPARQKYGSNPHDSCLQRDFPVRK